MMGHQGGTCAFSDYYGLADLDQISQVGGDMERLAYSRPFFQGTEHELYVGYFYRPGSAGLEVIQIHFGQRIVRKIALRIKAQAALEFSAIFLILDPHRSDCARPPPLLSGSGRPPT